MGKRLKRPKSKAPRRLARDEGEVDFETLVREEFKKLHRQYRLMEDARHAIAGASGKLSKQGRLLERLRWEKEDLLTDLKNARCRAYRAKDKSSIKTILEALERYEKYKADITACLLSIAEMESNVDRITQRLVEQRLKVQALYGQSMTVPEADRRQRILENRLYHVTTQFDTLVSQNKVLKQEINMMLKLRGNFYRRMMAIKKLSVKIKQRMGEVVYEATAAYDQRDEWVTKINILRERNDKDSKQHVLEIKEFQRVLHHDSKIHEFLAVKNREREQLENHVQRNDRKNKIKISDLDTLLAAYKKSFKSILKMAQSRDIESLVNAYLEEEQKNYAVFKFITDMNHETNSLQEDIIGIKEEIETLSKSFKQRNEDQEQSLSKYDTLLAETTEDLERTLNQWAETDKHMEQFCRLLDEAFAIAGCSNAGIITLLGNQNGMRPHNIALCMKAVEHRTTELLFEKGCLEVRKAVEIDGIQFPKKTQLWVQGQKPAPQGGPFRPQVHITGRIDSEQDDEDQDTKAWSEQPIYYEQMKESLLQKINTTVLDPEALGTSTTPSMMVMPLMEESSIDLKGSVEFKGSQSTTQVQSALPKARPRPVRKPREEREAPAAPKDADEDGGPEKDAPATPPYTEEDEGQDDEYEHESSPAAPKPKPEPETSAEEPAPSTPPAADEDDEEEGQETATDHEEAEGTEEADEEEPEGPEE